MENFEVVKNSYNEKKNILDKHLEQLHNIIVNSNCELEGNSFYFHLTTHKCNEFYNKQVNLFWIGNYKPVCKRICEIGFNAGHSTLLMLLNRDDTPLEYTVFDLGEHAYVKPALDYIKNTFQHVNFEYNEGDSIKTLPAWIGKNTHLCGQYDIVHVDGGHTEECIQNDLMNAVKLCKVGGIIIIDDTNDGIINNYVDRYLSTGDFFEITNILETYISKHRMIKKIR
jgi:hypothetical protein